MTDIEKVADAEIAAAGQAGSIKGENHSLKVAGDLKDIAGDLFQQSMQYDPEQLKADAKKVKKKLDFIVLPMMMTTYMLSFLDKQTLNYANAYGLQADTGMVGSNYSWVAAALYVGWLVSAYPSNLMLQRFPIGRLIGSMLFVWGSLCMLQCAVFNFSGFFAIRFFLGACEACISPAWILLTSMLWTREEQGLRTSLWIGMNGLSSILGALLAFGSGHAEGLAVPQWKLIFLIVGAMTFAWGFVIFFYLPDGPHSGKIFSEYERVVLVWRVSQNKTGVKNTQFQWYQVREAATDPKIYIIFLSAIGFGVLNGSVVNFISQIIRGFGFDPLQSSLMQTPGGAFDIVACIVFGWLSGKKNCFSLAMILGCLPGIIGLVGLLQFPSDWQYGLLACAWLQVMLGSPIVLNWTLPGVNVAGHTKRSAVIGVYFALFCAGNIAGPQMFLPSEAPRYRTAITGLLSTYCSVVVLQMIYTALCLMENRRRDKAGHYATDGEEAASSFKDLTDGENLHFRYLI